MYLRALQESHEPLPTADDQDTPPRKKKRKHRSLQALPFPFVQDFNFIVGYKLASIVGEFYTQVPYFSGRGANKFDEAVGKIIKSG